MFNIKKNLSYMYNTVPMTSIYDIIMFSLNWRGRQPQLGLRMWIVCFQILIKIKWLPNITCQIGLFTLVNENFFSKYHGCEQLQKCGISCYSLSSAVCSCMEIHRDPGVPIYTSMNNNSPPGNENMRSIFYQKVKGVV